MGKYQRLDRRAYWKRNQKKRTKKTQKKSVGFFRLKKPTNKNEKTRKNRPKKTDHPVSRKIAS